MIVLIKAIKTSTCNNSSNLKRGRKMYERGNFKESCGNYGRAVEG